MSTDTMTVQDQFLLSSFTRSRRARNISERTVDTYTESVRQFTVFLVRQGMPTQLESVTREHVESFIEELSQISQFLRLRCTKNLIGGANPLLAQISK